jgi:hypothetical protein
MVTSEIDKDLIPNHAIWYHGLTRITTMLTRMLDANLGGQKPCDLTWQSLRRRVETLKTNQASVEEPRNARCLSRHP